MAKINNRAENLQELIYRTIPLGRAMQLVIRELELNTICVEAPVPGVNSTSTTRLSQAASTVSVHSVPGG